jgi:hypothetical protein
VREPGYPTDAAAAGAATAGTELGIRVGSARDDAGRDEWRESRGDRGLPPRGIRTDDGTGFRADGVRGVRGGSGQGGERPPARNRQVVLARLIRCYSISIVMIFWAVAIVAGVDAVETIVPFLVSEAIAVAVYITEVKRRFREVDNARKRR